MQNFAFIIAGLIVLGLIVWRVLASQSPSANRTNADSDDGPPLSIVAFLTELPFVDIDVIARAMERGFGVSFEDADTPADADEEDHAGELRFADGHNFAMTTPMGSFMVQLGGAMHGVIVHDSPYFEDVEEASDSVNDMRGKQAILQHRCWIAVDHVGDAPAAHELQDTYARIGKLLLEIIDPSLCNAILLPRHQRFYPWRDGMEEALASGDVIEELGETAHVPVTHVDGDSPEMKQAVEQARQTWPQFVEAFESKRGESFGIKFLLPGDDEESFEFPWMEVTKIHDQIVQGKLANEPIGRTDLREGSLVTTRLADLNDWLYIDEKGQQQGGFTIPVLMKGLEQDTE